MTTSMRKFAIGLATLVAGCGLAGLAAPADAAVGTSGTPIAHRCNPGHIRVPLPVTHSPLGPFSSCRKTWLPGVRFKPFRSAGAATNLKPANGKLMKIRLFYVDSMGEHKVAVLDRKGQTVRLDYTHLTKVVITAL